MSKPKCYCGLDAVFHERSDVVYGKDYGPVYVCGAFPMCDGYVGAHVCPTNKKLHLTPKGTLVNGATRKWRAVAHKWFDPLWKKKMESTSKRKAREGAYQWLAAKLDIKRKDCHIAMFDIEQCKLVIDICKPYYKSKSNE